MKKVIILSLGLIVVLSACKAKKEALRSSIDEQILSAYWENQLQYDYLSLKGRINYTGEKSSQSASLNIRLKKDSVLWISMGLLGFEGIRVLITSDSFKMINRMNNTCLLRSNDYIRHVLGFDIQLSSLQNLLVGNALFQPSVYKVHQTDSTASLKGMMEDVQNEVFMNKTLETVRSLLNSAIRTQKADVEYKDFKDWGGFSLPARLLIIMDSGAEHSVAEINYTGADRQPVTMFPFTIPDGFKKI